MIFTDKELLAFDAIYDTSLEDRAIQSRGAFIKSFPIKDLKKLSLETYVVGFRSPTFCNFVESKTRYWASIQGGTAFKFGVYFGKVKSDEGNKYHFTDKFGKTASSALEAVKVALLELVGEGGRDNPSFEVIYKNQLSPMFKAKILSLYFPDRFLAVCSPEHLDEMARELGFPEDLPSSEIQNRLFATKTNHPITKSWSNPKFMRFLYERYIWESPKNRPPLKNRIKKFIVQLILRIFKTKEGSLARRRRSLRFSGRKNALLETISNTS